MDACENKKNTIWVIKKSLNLDKIRMRNAKIREGEMGT